MILCLHGGGNIRKNLGIIFLAVALSVVFAKAMFSSYKNEQVMSSDGNLYLLQYGSYISRDVMEENVKKLDDYFMYEDDDKYYVFLGAYTDLSIAKKVSKILDNKGIYTYIKNDYLGNSEVISKINTLEKNIIMEDDEEKINEINQKIIEILKKL